MQDISDVFELRTAKEWLRDSKKIPIAPLLGELWAESEIAVIFGKSGTGKSIFAVQLADQLARGGHGLEPFATYKGPQKVVYLDLERTSTQFIKRYSPERDPETHKITGKPYGFSYNLIRVEPKHEGKMEPAKIGELIAATGAKVLVIDSLAYLMQQPTAREAAALLQELRKIRNRFGISMLLIMNATRSKAIRPLTLADLPFSAAITAAVDSVFAIGKCTSRDGGRYIKHLKSAGRDVTIGSEHVPYYSLKHRDGNFPAFDFVGFSDESAVIANDGGRWERLRLNDVTDLRREGMTIREIAAELGMSRSAVHRRLRIADRA